MKTIIAGSRNITDYTWLLEAIELSGFENKELGITEVVSGRAKGVDELGERYSKEKGLKLKLFPARWNVHGRSAGYIRNTKMAKYAHSLIAIWDGESKGTKNMIEIAKGRGLLVFVYNPFTKTKSFAKKRGK